MTPIVVATRSAHKLREIREILGDLPGYELVDLNQAGIPEAPEEEAPGRPPAPGPSAAPAAWRGPARERALERAPATASSPPASP